MSKELNTAIGGRIRAYRESLGKNREAFSEMIGLSPQFLAEAENGKKGLSAESIYKICTNCDMSADYLVLGKLDRQGLKSPLDYILKDMPGDYAVQYAQVLKTVNDMVTEARKDGEKQQKNTEREQR
ncbi:MAG: helix-turn-helix transcriptional regulator [Lachnospiraceae bacterium]|nr:helix-turn-helix transcriptional regulator [Lachnospiraceae bacterium]